MLGLQGKGITYIYLNMSRVVKVRENK